MAIIGYNESSLRNSEVFSFDYFTGANEPIAKTKKLIASAKEITHEDIPLAYIQLKQYSNTITRTAIKAFENNDIILLYNTDPAKAMIQIIPFLTFKKGDKYVTYIYGDPYITKTRGKDTYTMNPGIFNDLIVGATLSNAYKTNPTNLYRSEFLEKLLMNLWTAFVMRILNREYLLSSEKILYEVIQYYCNRFFLTHIFDSTNTNLNIVASSHYKLANINDQSAAKFTYDEKDPQNISQLLMLIKDQSPRMANLTFSLFLNNWINYFYMPSALAIDNIEYLLFMVFSLKNDTGLITTGASAIVKEMKGIKSFEEELMKIL